MKCQDGISLSRLFISQMYNIIFFNVHTDCISGKVRLIGGQRDTEGTVEVCFNNVWGLISANDWDDNDASVVCSQIGYLRDG